MSAAAATLTGRVAPRHEGPVLCAAFALSLTVLGLVGVAVQHAGFIGDGVLSPVSALAYGVLGPWIWLRGSVVLGRRLAVVGVSAGLSWCAQAWSDNVVAAWVSQWAWLLPVLLVPLALTRFPDGEQVHAGRLLMERVLAASTALAVTLLAVAALAAPHTLLTGASDTKPAWTAYFIDAAIVSCLVWLVTVLALVASVARQCVTAQGQRRSQMLCLVAAVAVLVLAVVGLVVQSGTVFEVIAALSLPVGCALAVLQYSLYDLDLLVHRLAVWVALTAVVLAAVVAVVGLSSTSLPSGWSKTVQVVLLVALVLVVDPLRRWLQTRVDRLLFGDRNRPERALSRLGAGVGAAAAHQSAEQLCASVGGTLAVPWVAVRSVDGRIDASWGRTTSAPVDVRLELGGVVVGSLSLCPRRAGERFTAGEMKLVSSMAAQVAVAVQALALAAQLQDARERLVASREAERKRLRDDLHDGLGPALVGVRMQVHALRGGRGTAPRQASESSSQAARLLEQVDVDLERCVGEVSRVVDGLRPAALDSGLLAALEAEAQRLAVGGLDVRVEAGPAANAAVATPGALPAGVETAAYRIVCEAMANAAQHAHAGHVHVLLEVHSAGQKPGPGELTVRVSDDGVGVVQPRDGGVGMGSMRDRAEELGGVLAVDAAPGKGCTVQAMLPVQPAISLLPT